MENEKENLYLLTVYLSDADGCMQTHSAWVTGEEIARVIRIIQSRKRVVAQRARRQAEKHAHV